MNIDLLETQSIIESTKEQVYLQGKTHTGNHAKPRRGQVFNCLLGVGVGSEFQKRRPCVVLSNTVNNINSSIIIVAPITHTNKSYPVFVPVSEKRDQSGSVVLGGFVDISNMRAISSYRLAGLIYELDDGEMKLIDAAAARHLDLMQHYNAIVNASKDREKYVAVLLDILSKLRSITGVGNNEELIITVRTLVSCADMNTRSEKTVDR